MSDNSKRIRFLQYFEAITRLYKEGIRKGRLFLSEEKIKKRYEKCERCEFFTGLKCELCGCCGGNVKLKHFNKLAFPTERCPKNPPEWVEEDV